MADPHAVLGVSKGASKEEIKSAYRKACFQHHPDRHALSPEHVQRSAATSFKAVTEAYEALMDDPRRHAHTRSRASGFGSSGAAAYGGRSYSAEYANYSGYSGGSYSGYNQFRRRTGFSSFASVRQAFSSGMSRQEALATLAVAGAMLVGAVLLEPLASSLWERQNQGKLFRDIEQDVVRAQNEELLRLRATRAAQQQARQVQQGPSAAAQAQFTAAETAAPLAATAAPAPAAANAGAGEQAAAAALPAVAMERLGPSPAGAGHEARPPGAVQPMPVGREGELAGAGAVATPVG